MVPTAKSLLQATPNTLGGKRNQARAIFGAIAEAGFPPGRGCVLVDPFAGGCSVALLGKLLGYRVLAGDTSPRAEAIGRGLLVNSTVQLEPEDAARALTADPKGWYLPPLKQLPWPEGSLRVLAGICRAAADTAHEEKAWLLRALMVKLASHISIYGQPRMTAHQRIRERNWDALTDGQIARMLVPQTRPRAMGVRVAKSMYGVVFSNGQENEFHRTDALDIVKSVQERGIVPDVVYCNPPEAPIWMADLSFKPLGDVIVGDEVIGWAIDDVRAGLRGLTPETSARPRQWLTTSRVLAVGRRNAPVVKVTLASGRVLRCTSDHLWLRHPHPSNGRVLGRRRSRAGDFVPPAVGETLCRVIDPTPVAPLELRQLAGWLGGMFDGEGWASYRAQPVIAQSLAANPDICAEIERACERLGIEVAYRSRRGGNGSFSILGGRQGYVDFVNTCRPVKWRLIAERVLNANWRVPDEIVAVEDDGDDEVISMTTSTGNYIAWGYASKNCDPPYPDTEGYSRNYVGIDSILEGRELPIDESRFSRPQGWQHLRGVLDACGEVPLVVVSLGGENAHVSVEELQQLVREAGREPRATTLEYTLLRSRATSKSARKHEWIIAGTRPNGGSHGRT